MGWTIETYGERHAAAVAALWNEAFGARLPLRPEVLRTRWQPMAGEPTAGWIARDGDAVVGALLARFPTLPWFPTGVGFVTLLVVSTAARGRGLGRALLAAATETARTHGYQTLVFGGGPGHLVPGVPTDAPLATWHFLRRVGAVPREVFHDLLVDLTVPLPPATLPAEALLEPVPRDEMSAFLAREFPGEWEVDVATAYDAGASVLGLRLGGELVGFAAAHGPGQWPPPPSLFWTQALPGPVAGLGPLGIAAAHRNRGLGLAMVVGALARLARSGARWVIIDWTERATFYGRAGAHVWRTYQMVALPLG
ncbi:MAG: GNAT family N-acetyltransferase [Thermomicrobium sp.]|nr:GNAT family N-acetyltransferase [Thermomicrobium sp.]